MKKVWEKKCEKKVCKVKMCLFFAELAMTNSKASPCHRFGPRNCSFYRFPLSSIKNLTRTNFAITRFRDSFHCSISIQLSNSTFNSTFGTHWDFSLKIFSFKNLIFSFEFGWSKNFLDSFFPLSPLSRNIEDSFLINLNIYIIIIIIILL